MRALPVALLTLQVFCTLADVRGAADQKTEKDVKPENAKVSGTGDCVWGRWGYWSSCSTNCGNGVRSRRRYIDDHGSSWGTPCRSSDGWDERDCHNVNACEDGGSDGLAALVSSLVSAAGVIFIIICICVCCSGK